MKIGDLVKYTQKYKSGKINYIYGIVVDLKRALDDTKVFKIRWFDKSKDSWHKDPSRLPRYKAQEIKVISEA